MIVFPVSFIKMPVSTFSSETFTTVGTTTWTAPTGVTLIEYLVVGGGGGGGNGYDNAGGGGGGAGMVLTGTLSVTPGTSYTVTVGDGGAGGANARANNAGSAGNNSVLDSITALGGGAGQGSRTGGSAGAAQISNTTAPTGGTGTGGGFGGKGGGGATGAGSANSGTAGGAGGAGLASSLSGSSTTYGVGGAGANSGTQNGGTPGSSNTGNGGQAGGATSANSVGGGKGGSGIVIIVNRSTKGTLSYPGISAQDIFNSGQTTSGWYYIQTSTMAQPRQVYCNMSDESGGWMLIGYTPSFNNLSGGLGLGLSYPNTWQNGEGTLNRLRVNAMDLWYHNSSAQCTQVMKMATTTYNQEPLLNNMTIANKVVYTNPGNLSLSTQSTYPIVNNTAMAGTWYPIKGHTLMNTSLAVDAPGDWIYQANSWWTVCGPSTQLVSGGRSGNAQGTGSWTNPTANNLYGMSDVAATTNSNRTDIQTYAVYIK